MDARKTVPLSIPDPQREAASFLETLAGRPPAETHISALFVGGDTVFKLRKAVRLSFLDFSTLAARERYARRELALNRDAAPGLYRDVVPVVRGADGLCLGGDGETVDWVVRMARVPACDFLDRIAAEHRLDDTLLDAMADAVAAYHGALPPLAEPPDSTARLAATLEGNARAAREARLDEAAVAGWETRAGSALAAAAPSLAARADRVRRGHGDLHLGNLCLWRGRPVPFDALEFDEALATTDLGYDLAFLLMDLDQRVGRAAANRVMNRYVDVTGDAGLVGPLPFFLSLRAMVRAHVAGTSGNPEQAARYLRAAGSYLDPQPARRIAIGGLPGTGKSTLARAVAPALGPAPGALILRSDTIRKRQHGVPPEQRLPPEAYGAAANAAVIDELVALGAAAGGHAVIADATFLDPAWRRCSAAAGFSGVWLDAPRATLAARIAGRRDDASDATPEVLARMPDPQVPEWPAIDVSDPTLALARLRQLLAMPPTDPVC